MTGPSTDDVEERELSINCTPLMPRMLKNDRNTSDKEKEHDISKPDSLIPTEFAQKCLELGKQLGICVIGNEILTNKEDH